MPRLLLLGLCAALLPVPLVQSVPGVPRRGLQCGVYVRLENGLACGVHRVTNNGTRFASFLGLPYGKQPVGERRFSELEPVEPWEGFYDATVEGPICPQHDVFYGPLQENHKMDEACIYANVHVPLYALPELRPARHLRHPYETGLSEKEDSGLPILVFVHGGGFAFGSGGTGLHGPEYLMSKDIIVITFNYRLNVFGFLSLNSSSIPGNNGLRDIVTLLKWVKKNARTFGGNPDDVTLAGQSAGASCTHILTMSSAAQGLFRRAILMSGTGLPNYFTTSPAYAALVANMLLSNLNITASNPDDMHKQLTSMPLHKIMAANKEILEQFGLTAFMPVVESPFPGITTILEDDPEILFAKGRGMNMPLLIGYTNAECETFRPNFEKIDILGRIEENPLQILSVNLLFKLPTEISLDLAKKVEERYFNGEPNMDKYLNSCSDTYYNYPALTLAEKRARMQGAPVFLYKFSYDADFSVFKKSKGLHFKGAGHVEDMTFIFRADAMNNIVGFSPPSHKDQLMIEWMTTFVKNFMYCDNPTCDLRKSAWPPVDSIPGYQQIERPKQYSFQKATKAELEMMEFFDSFQTRTI